MAESWRHDKRKTAERGYGGRWQKARKTYLMANPLCVMCKAKGLIVPACVVDHVIPHKGDQNLFWDTKNNWQALCKPCHDRDKQAMEKGKQLIVTGEDGWPI